MDPTRFDTLAKTLSGAETRRGLVRLVAALPLAGALGGLLEQEHADGQSSGAGVGGGRGRRQRRRGRHQSGQDKHNRKGKDKQPCATAGQIPRKGTRKGCCAGLSIDASGRCAAPAPGPTPDSCTGLKPTATSATQGLQEAIDGAEPGDTIRLCAGTWTLTETVVIGKNLTLIGAGDDETVLNGNNAVGVLRISPIDTDNITVTVSLQDLRIRNGNSGFGGGIYNGGLNSNLCALSLLRVNVTGNTATLAGGGIYNDRSTLTVEDGSIIGGAAGEGNTATSSGGGIYNNAGTLTLKTGSQVTGNTAGNVGGGITNAGGTVTLEGADVPSPIVVNNCTDNCAGAPAVANCAVTLVSCS